MKTSRSESVPATEHQPARAEEPKLKWDPPSRRVLDVRDTRAGGMGATDAVMFGS